VKILLVRLRLIGDVVFTTPVIRALKRVRPGAHLSYLVERAAAPVVACLKDLDQVIQVEHTRGWGRLRDDLALGRRLRRERFDLVLDFHGGPRGAWLTWASQAPVRVGYTVTGRSWMYTRCVGRTRQLRRRHSVENQWDLLRAAVPEVGDPTPSRDPVVMAEHPDAREEVARRLAAAGIGPDLDVIVIHVSAGNPFRRWPAASFTELAVRLSSARANRRIILTSGPSEARAAAEVGAAARARLGPGSAAIADVGDLSLAELRSLIGRAALFVGGDSGPLHVAATTETPVVALFGPTLRERSAPWRNEALVTEAVEPGPLPCRPCDQRRCAPGDFRCLVGLTAERVAAAAERALGRARGAQPGSRESETR
jgi:lipopolysaccharide heptosyltransferase II